jgi:hypothetical protein
MFRKIFQLYVAKFITEIREILLVLATADFFCFIFVVIYLFLAKL